MKLFIIGMPGCGKTTVGKICAKTLKVNFYDTDDVSESLMGITPEEAITRFGEKFFREYESKALKKICENDGFICATGGGIITVEANNMLMKQKGTVAFIDRDNSLLIKYGRPLSKNIDLLYKNRIEIYRTVSDFTVNGNGTIEETAKELLKKYEDFNNKRSESESFGRT